MYFIAEVDVADHLSDIGVPSPCDLMDVAAWFEAPLDFLLDPVNQHERTALFQGRTRHYYEIIWEDRRIWGVTAAIIVNLSRRLPWR